MDLKTNFILINGLDKTFQVESIRLDGYKYVIKFKNSDKFYTYATEKVVWLTNPKSIELDGCRIFINGSSERNIKALNLFSSNTAKFYAVTYANDFTKHFNGNEVEIRRSCLTSNAANIFNYLRQCAGVNKLGTEDDDESSERKGILSSIFERIDFVDESTAAAVYLNPKSSIKHTPIENPLFPSGCNASQSKAVKSALSSQISVIQGPPGTGKTQTILNIIANLLIARKSILVVSNNNSATENVLEKLSKNGLGFLVAPLGKKENKEAFIANQPPLNPDLPLWRKTTMELDRAKTEVNLCLEKIETIFALQERLSVCRQELAEVKIERIHFREEHNQDFPDREIRTLSSRILDLSNLLKTYAVKYDGVTGGLLKRIKRFFDKFSLELRFRLLMDIREKLSPDSLPNIINLLDWHFYTRRIQELESEIEDIESNLARLDAKALMKSLTENSMTILKATLAQRYERERPLIASVKDLFNNGESVLDDYPIVLSTTFSSRLCFNSDTLFDYVIMDEASQVSIDTGLLALTCAKNAVVVGDTMQLPNVVKDEDRNLLDEIRRQYEIPESYDVARQSFLSSVLAALPDIPETLLREHYRCHPDLINFCNQKFYGGELLIMTEREDAADHLFVLKTSPGHHCRGYYNQREIDAVKIELLPLLDAHDQTGIIAPYNDQVDQFCAQIPDVEAATVHKYQGREKDTIILSVADDMITEFADNANLLNVAVSRAKNKFCLVVTGNPQELKGNVHDLINYIVYQQGTIIESKLRSIFDYLFTKIHEHNQALQSVSDFESENLTFDLIKKIGTTYPHLSHIKALCHYPLRYLIRDVSGLSEAETKYALHPSTHIDFLIINRVTKEPLLAIETDGYSYHNQNTDQFRRDRMKDSIFEKIGLTLLRLSTIGHSEEERIVTALTK